MATTRHETPPSLDDLERLAREALGTLPDFLRAKLDGVVIRVDEFPDEATEREMELESPFDLLGLYRGVSLDRASVNEVRQHMNMIFLYRRPILDYWAENEETLGAIISHVLVHEIGHHFGLSDDDMEAIDAAWG